MAPYEALYGINYRSPICWTEVGDMALLGLKLCKTLLRKSKLSSKGSRQHRTGKRIMRMFEKDLEYEVGDHVFVRVILMKGQSRFGKKGKLSPRYIRLFQILERLGPVVYRVALPSGFEQMHNVFHVSMLRGLSPKSV